MTTKIPALFFDGEGRGPLEAEVWIERHEPKEPDLGDELYFGLRVGSFSIAGSRRDDGGYMLQPKPAAALHRELGLAIGTDPLVLERNQLAAEVNFHRAGHDMWKSLATTRQQTMDGFAARLDAAEAEVVELRALLAEAHQDPDNKLTSSLLERIENALARKS